MHHEEADDGAFVRRVVRSVQLRRRSDRRLVADEDHGNHERGVQVHGLQRTGYQGT